MIRVFVMFYNAGKITQKCYEARKQRINTFAKIY